jgi:[protein-PII] uridylyltransferase
VKVHVLLCQRVSVCLCIGYLISHHKMSPSPLVLELREFLEAGRARLWKRQSWRAPIRPWLDEHSQLLDETLTRIYNAAWETARAAHEGTPDSDASLVLIAIGGYGRAELCPFSDIDIAFVPSEEENSLLDAVIKEAFKLIVEVLIDGAKLDVGYAYRPIADIERLDHQSKAALLEARCIAGNERLMHEVRDEVYRSWDAVEFLLEKAEERRSRSAKVALSMYAVEPNLKDGAGALRDIHFAFWSAAALLKTENPLEELVSRGVVTAADAENLVNSREFFLKLRVWLHLTAGEKPTFCASNIKTVPRARCSTPARAALRRRICWPIITSTPKTRRVLRPRPGTFAGRPAFLRRPFFRLAPAPLRGASLHAAQPSRTAAHALRAVS